MFFLRIQNVREACQEGEEAAGSRISHEMSRRHGKILASYSGNITNGAELWLMHKRH